MNTTVASDFDNPPLKESERAASSTLQNASELTGRILLSAIFLISGLGKLAAYQATAGYMDAVGVPGALLPLVIAFEVIAGLAITVGWKTRVTAFLLAGFSLLSGTIFHGNFADQMQMIMFLKNVAMAGGFLLLVANGAGRWSLDARVRSGRRSTSRATV